MNILPVRSAGEREAFLRLPLALYRDNPYFVPPLWSTERRRLNPARNPFFEHAEAAQFLAEKDGQLVGRIAAIVDRAHNEVHREKTGFWGYFESENEPPTAQELFERAGGWLRERGMTRMLGPANPSLHDPCGLLVDGFNWSPFVNMPYNPGYYVSLVEGAGFRKAIDLWAYILSKDFLVRERIDRLDERARDRSAVTIRTLELGRWKEELDRILEITNDAWESSFGFVPRSRAEFRFAWEGLRPILLPELAFLAEVGGKPAGFALGLPDINLVLKKLRGSLFPFGWFKFRRAQLRKIPTFRIAAVGVRRQFQHLGVGLRFYQKFMEAGRMGGYQAAELSWVLETDRRMNRLIQTMGGKPYKGYRLYERAL